MKITLFYITCPNEETAVSLGHKAVENKIAACANIFPIDSIFPWENNLTHEEEYVLILKSIPTLKDAVSHFISGFHPYDVPCIMHWNVDVNDSYGEWINAQVNSA